MRPNISITLLTPHVTVERYAELTGLDSETIKAMLADGRLTRHAGCDERAGSTDRRTYSYQY